jgi:hypothetical protein
VIADFDDFVAVGELCDLSFIRTLHRSRDATADRGLLAGGIVSLPNKRAISARSQGSVPCSASASSWRTARAPAAVESTAIHPFSMGAVTRVAPNGDPLTS